MKDYPAPTAQEFSVVSVQATLFTPAASVVPQEVAKRLIGGLWGERFDGDPVMLPSDQGIPREIPKVILRDKSGAWRAEIADARVSVKWGLPDLAVADNHVPQLLSQASERLGEYRAEFSPRVGRLAAVVHRFAANPLPGLTLASHFCLDEKRAGPLKRSDNFELHSHKVYAFEGFTVNSWVRNKTARVSTGGEGILVEQDLNTLSEQAASRDFSSEETRSFFAKAAVQLDEILALYYPSETATEVTPQ